MLESWGLVMTKDEALKLALEALEDAGKDDFWRYQDKAITAIKEALAQPEQEPVAMRMPKVGDKVVCIEDDSLGTVAYLTAGGSPEIRFDDGSHGTYLLREFAELFRYASPPQRKPLTAMEVYDVVHDADLDWHTGFALGEDENRFVVFARAIEAAHGIKE